ncbi:MAG: metal-dependent hydrolase [Planctomycetes bacterium]|nr:metal-dependent hydrolase [Planctomycetota bacterium]
MDTFTHAFLGAATAQLGFRQRIGRAAAWVAAAAGAMPDLDVFIAPIMTLTGAETNGLSHLQMHRGITHSLFLSPLLALPVAAGWWWLRRALRRREMPQAVHKTSDKPPPHFLWLFCCVWLAVLVHPLLDLTTSYGTQILAPLTDRRFALDCMPIVDIFYTPTLILTLLACWIVRLAKHGVARRTTLIIGWAGFLLSCMYIAAGRVIHDRVVDSVIPLAGQEKVVTADAYPAIGSIFLWRAVVQTDSRWIVVRRHLFSDRPIDQEAETITPKANNEWIDRAWRLPEVKTYVWFTGDRLRPHYHKSNAGCVVEFHDMRYGFPLQSAESYWPLNVVFDADGNFVSASRAERFRAGSPRFAVAGEAWQDLWNP